MPKVPGEIFEGALAGGPTRDVSKDPDVGMAVRGLLSKAPERGGGGRDDGNGSEVQWRPGPEGLLRDFARMPDVLEGDDEGRLRAGAEESVQFRDRVPLADEEGGELGGLAATDPGSTNPGYGASSTPRGPPGGPNERGLEQAGRVCRGGELRGRVSARGHPRGDRSGRPEWCHRPRRREHGRSKGLGRATAPGAREPARVVAGFNPSAKRTLEPHRRIAVRRRREGRRVLPRNPSRIPERCARRCDG